MERAVEVPLYMDSALDRRRKYVVFYVDKTRQEAILKRCMPWNECGADGSKVHGMSE